MIFQRYSGFYFSDALVGQTSFSSSGEESETQLDPTNNHCDSPPITTGWTQGKITNSSLSLILIGEIKGQICDSWVFWTGTWGVNVLASCLPPVCGGPEDGNGLGLCVCVCVCARMSGHMGVWAVLKSAWNDWFSRCLLRLPQIPQCHHCPPGHPPLPRFWDIPLRVVIHYGLRLMNLQLKQKIRITKIIVNKYIYIKILCVYDVHYTYFLLFCKDIYSFLITKSAY